MSTSDRVEGELVADGAGQWDVAGAAWIERLNATYRATVHLASGDALASAMPMLGRSVEVLLRRRDVEERLSGLVTEVREGLSDGSNARAVLTIEPALSSTMHKKDTRIFQHMTVPQILEQVLGEDLGAFGRSLSNELTREYPTREYTVQYDESDYDFAHRLMEEEGIVYYFRHEGGPELLALTDRTPQHPTIECETGRSLTFSPRADAALDHTEAVFALEPMGRITGNRVAVRSFDWTHPSMITESRADAGDDGPALESYEVRPTVTRGGFGDNGYTAHDAETQAALLGELQRRDRELAGGRASSVAVRAGARFNLDAHPQLEHNREYLAVEVEHRYRLGVTPDDERTVPVSYQNIFTAIPADTPWRPDRVRDRPRISGVQTATVVGPVGEEIHTDPHGRVRVQFHWDRLGQRDERSSCWMRVMQPMGGPGWGFTFVPRIGQEVVITFVDGDPDQPIVSGAIFNGDNPIPLDYPADKTRMTIKSSSSPGGGGFNELRFEDRAGKEEIWLHGEKDWNTLIKHDLNRRVDNDEAQRVAMNRTRTVGVNETVTIGANQTRMVGVDKSEVVGNNRTRRVENTESVTVGVDRNKVIGQNETVQIGAEAVQSIGKSLTQTIGQNAIQTVELNAVQTVGASQTVSVGASSTTNVVVNKATSVGGDASLTTGKSLSQKVGDNFVQRVKSNATQNVGANRTTTVLLNDTLSVGAASNTTVGLTHSLSVTAGQTVTVGGPQVISAGTGRTLTVVTGDYDINVPAGDFTLTVGEAKISITDSEIVLESTKKITVKSTDEVEIAGDKGVKIVSSGGDVAINGGPNVKINCE